MLDSSSFDQTLYNKLKLIIEVQRDLLKLDITNVTEIGNSILNRRDIVETKEGISLLTQCINDIVDARPTKIEAFVDLVIFLEQNESSTNYLHLLKENLLQCIQTKRKLKDSFLFFIRMLYIRKVIPIESILDQIYQMPPKFPADFTVKKCKLKQKNQKISSNSNNHSIDLNDPNNFSDEEEENDTEIESQTQKQNIDKINSKSQKEEEENESEIESQIQKQNDDKINSKFQSKEDENDKGIENQIQNQNNDKINSKSQKVEEEDENEVINDDDDNLFNVNENFAENSPSARMQDTILCQKKCRAIKWFYPEIKRINPKFISIATTKLYYQIPPLFTKNEEEETILEIMNSGYSNDSISKIIREDDIDSFKKIVSKYSFNFNINSKIKSTQYERCSILSHDPSLIQYSAFFNSIKIFKYLYLNKALLADINNNKYYLTHFAIVGGSAEIIHLLEQNEFKFFNIISFSIQFYQNEMFSWLLEKYFPKNENEFELMDNYELNNLIQKYVHRYYFRYRDTHYYNDDFEDDDDILNNYFEFRNSNDFNDDDDLNGKFKYFNFNIVFHTILNSNNYLALFILFNYGMSINAIEKRTKRTLLHYAIEKGKFFIVNLLLSNKFIQPFLKDKQSLSPIVYSLKFSRENIFEIMIKNEKVLNSLTDNDYIMLSYYSFYCDLKNSMKFIQKNWKINLINLIEIGDIETFSIAMTYLPLSFFIDQIEDLLRISFKFNEFDYFCMIGNRIIIEKDLVFNCDFYFLQQKKKKESQKEFFDLCRLFIYYNLSGRSFVNYYEKYKKNFNNVESSQIIIQDFYLNLIDDFNFTIGSKNNQINLHFTNDENLSLNPKIEFKKDVKEVKQKKKKINNKPSINTYSKLDFE